MAPGRSAPSWPSARSMCSRRCPRRPVEDRPAGQARLRRSISTPATVTCPAGQVAPISTEPSGSTPRELRQRVCRDCPLRGAAARPPRDAVRSDRQTRRAAERRPPGTRGPDRGRAPASHPTADRAAARPARRPLRRSQEPLLRPRQSPTAGRLGRRTGQPQPDRPAPGRPDRLSATAPRRRPRAAPHSPHTTRAADTPPAQSHFFRSLLAAQQLEIRARHQPDELLEARGGRPAQDAFGLGVVADEVVDLGRPDEGRIDLDVGLQSPSPASSKAIATQSRTELSVFVAMTKSSALSCWSISHMAST